MGALWIPTHLSKSRDPAFETSPLPMPQPPKTAGSPQVSGLSTNWAGEWDRNIHLRAALLLREERVRAQGPLGESLNTCLLTKTSLL